MGGCCQSERFKGKVITTETMDTAEKKPESEGRKTALKGKTEAVTGAREKRETKRSRGLTSSASAEEVTIITRRRNKRAKTQVQEKPARPKKGDVPTVGMPGIIITSLTRPIAEKYKKLVDLHCDRATNVYLAESARSKKQRVVKELRKARAAGGRKKGGNSAEEHFRREVVTVSNLDHPNILKTYKLYEDNSHFYIVSELAKGGNLIDYITATKTLSEVFAAKVVHQLLQVLRYCHEQGVMHRSVQPRNILLAVAQGEDPVVKVTGFGSAHLLTHQEKLTLSVASVYYIAPEALNRDYLEKSDVWSLGIILYQLLCGNPPFMGEFTEDIADSILNKRLQFPESQWSSVNREAIDLVTSMLSKSPAKRASVEDCLSHPWILRYKEAMVASAPTATIALANLQRFNASQALKQAVLKFISDEIENSEETKKMIKSFKIMDRNGDGVLSRQELISAYEKSMPRDLACSTVDQVMKSVDSDNSGVIDFSEFILASLHSKTVLSQPNLLLLFRLFDEDGSGKVTIAEIKEKVRRKDNSVSDELWDELVGQVDSNSDRELDFDEFSRLMKLAVA